MWAVWRSSKLAEIVMGMCEGGKVTEPPPLAPLRYGVRCLIGTRSDPKRYTIYDMRYDKWRHRASHPEGGRTISLVIYPVSLIREEGVRREGRRGAKVRWGMAGKRLCRYVTVTDGHWGKLPEGGQGITI